MHWVSLFIDRNTAVYFDHSFRIEYNSEEVLNNTKDKLITHNIFRIKIMNLLCVYFIVLLP